MKSIHRILLLTPLALFLAINIHCDDPFADDIPGIKDHNVEFHPENLAKLIGASENDLPGLFPPGPNRRMTFIHPRQKTLYGNTYKYDRLYTYRRLEHQEVFENSVSGYDAKEFIWLAVFCLDGFVQAYFVKHKVMGDDGEWTPGPYDSGGFASMDIWPESPEDVHAYRAQFPDNEPHSN